MNILITREADKADKFAKILKRAGHKPFSMPMIECVPVKAEIEGHYDYGVFTSINAVNYFQPYKRRVTFDMTAAVGSATKKALLDAGMDVDLIPEEYSAEGLKKLFGGMDVRGKTFLLAGAETRAGDFEDWLKMNGCRAEIVTIYRTDEIKREKADIDAFIAKNRIDVITFASPSSVRAFFKCTDTDRELVAIGETTAAEIRKFGHTCHVPDEYTLVGMTKVIDGLTK